MPVQTTYINLGRNGLNDRLCRVLEGEEDNKGELNAEEQHPGFDDDFHCP
jgi:hypothetical protein